MHKLNTCYRNTRWYKFIKNHGHHKIGITVIINYGISYNYHSTVFFSLSNGNSLNLRFHATMQFLFIMAVQFLQNKNY